MALATPQGPLAVPRQPARPSTVSLAAAPGYSVSERAGDLSSAESWAVALVHSPFALAKLSDGRYLAVRAARDLQEGLVELGLSYTTEPPADDDEESCVPVVAGGTLSSLAADRITHLWLGFFEGHAETAKGMLRTLGPDGGSSTLGIRYVSVEAEAAASSSRLRTTRKPLGQWLEETKWLSPFAIRLREEGHDEAPGGGLVEEAREEPVEEAAPVQLARLQALRQVLRLVGSLGKNARQWDAAPAAEFFRAALGSRPKGKSALISAAVRLNSKVEMSPRRKRAFGVAVEAGGIPVEQLSWEDKGILVRDHLIPSTTPSSTPQRGTSTPGCDVQGRSSLDSDEPMTPPPSKRKSSLRQGKRPLSESEAESEAEVECLTRSAGKRGGASLLQTKADPEVSSYSIPDDFDDEDEHEAYRERAGRALARLKEAYGSEWILGARPKDERALRSMREEVIDIVSRCAARLSRGEGERAEGRQRPADSFTTAAAGGEKDALSGAAALSTELQLGAVSSDVAERLHQQAAAVQFSGSGDVGTGIRMAPESLRDDLVRAVGSKGRVDATGECSHVRTALPAAVKRMGAAFTDSVQQCLLELPSSDESGMQYIIPPAARKLAAAVVSGQLRVVDFVKETRILLGSAAPPKESLDELREAWRLMRTALMGAALPLTLLTATDQGLAKVDARIGATAASTRVGAKCLAAWLRRVTDTWETQCVRFRQLNGPRPSLADCVQRHDAFLATRTQAAALRAVFRVDPRRGGSAYRETEKGVPFLEREGGEQPQGKGKKRTRRGGREKGGQPREGPDSDESEARDEGARRSPPEGRRCSSPDKPRLPDDKFKEFRKECKMQCPDACFAFLRSKLSNENVASASLAGAPPSARTVVATNGEDHILRSAGAASLQSTAQEP
ncbi:MAG: hypothetical protein SGPRY_001635, partial [Prymnesium sp.]